VYRWGERVHHLQHVEGPYPRCISIRSRSAPGAGQVSIEVKVGSQSHRTPHEENKENTHPLPLTCCLSPRCPLTPLPLTRCLSPGCLFPHCPSRPHRLSPAASHPLGPLPLALSPATSRPSRPATSRPLWPAASRMPPLAHCLLPSGPPCLTLWPTVPSHPPYTSRLPYTSRPAIPLARRLSPAVPLVW